MDKSEHSSSSQVDPGQDPEPGATVMGRPIEVTVDERGVERAIRKLKRMVAMEGVLKHYKRSQRHEKPSDRKRRKRRDAERRRRRAARRMARRTGRH